MIISSSKSCKGNFISSLVSSAPLKIPMNSIQVFDETGVTKSVEIEKNKKKGNLFINDIFLQVQQKLSTNTYLGELVIDAQSFDGQSKIVDSNTLRRKSLRLPLKISTDASNKIVECADLSEAKIRQLMCSDMQGIYNPTTEKCDISQRIVKEIVQNNAATGRCPSGQFLEGFDSIGNKLCNSPPAAVPPVVPPVAPPSTGGVVLSLMPMVNLCYRV